MPWIYRTVTGDVGPIDDGKLKDLASVGEIKASTQIKRVGMNHFVDASSIKGLVFYEPPIAEEVPEPPKIEVVQKEPVKKTAAKQSYFEPYVTPRLLVILWWAAILVTIMTCFGCVFRIAVGDSPESFMLGILGSIIWLFVARVMIESVAVIFEICNHLRHIRDK